MMTHQPDPFMEFASFAQFFTNWINYVVYQETPYDWKLFEDSALSASL